MLCYSRMFRGNGLFVCCFWRFYNLTLTVDALSSHYSIVEYYNDFKKERYSYMRKNMMTKKECKKLNKAKDFYIDILKNNKLKFFILFMLILVTSFTGIGVAYVYMKVIDCITYDKFNRIIIAALFYFFINIINYFLGVLVTCISQKISNDIDINIRERIFSAILYQDGEIIAHTDSSEYISMLTTDASKISGFFGSIVFPSVMSITHIISMVVFLFIIQWRILAIVALIQPILYIIQVKMKRRMRIISERTRTATVMYVRTIKENTANLFKIKILGKNELFKESFSTHLKEMKNSELISSVTGEINNSLLSAIDLIPLVLILLIGGYEVSTKATSIGALMLYIQYYEGLFSPIREIMETVFNIESYKPSINRVILLLERTTINKKYVSVKNYDTIRFSKVNFRYPNEEKILNNFDLTLRKGQTYGIFGESGCGKSTLCRLILGLWSVDSGKILIGGENIDEIDKEELYKNITYLSQDSFLFNDSIYNNISMGDNLSEDEFYDIMKKVNLDDMIHKLDNGKESIVGDNGILLSGGQKKRIELARLLIHKTPVLILDEPTNGLDNENSFEIISIFMKEFKDSLVIIISHQPEIVDMCDNVLDFKNRRWIKRNGKTCRCHN